MHWFQHCFHINLIRYEDVTLVNYKKKKSQANICTWCFLSGYVAQHEPERGQVKFTPLVIQTCHLWCGQIVLYQQMSDLYKLVVKSKNVGSCSRSLLLKLSLEVVIMLTVVVKMWATR